ncbi:MAG: EAL domain-containing protein, partial [Erysipelotrichaceae bacterium]|nr:EAL domain-containing protein [Erysipelotrichaceae bacterium]
TGIGMEYAFAATKGDKELYSILDKTVGMVPSSKINAVMTKYISEKEAEVTFKEFFMQNLATFLGIIAGVLLVILALSMRTIRAMKRARRDEKLIASAETDHLTGTYSKNFLFEYARQMMKKNKNKPIDAIVVDIERFHSINTLHGQEEGDKVLSSMGEALRSVFTDKDTIIGRIDADRFCIFRWNKWDETEYKAFLTELQKKVEDLHHDLKIHIRMGVFPGQKDRDPETLYDRARIACNIARGQYQKLPLVIYDDDIRKKRAYEQRLINDMRSSIKNGNFEVYYQPQYDIQCDPPRLVSAEALIRWRHPELGMVMPGDFIPLFEANGMIGEVDKFVWNQVAKQVAAWKSRFGKLIPVSVNLSRVDIFDPDLEATLDSIIKDNKLDYRAIKLEVTESAYTENATQVIHIIEKLRRKGFEIELDDFGTGYSSLGMLSSLPIDVLKMDRSFIVNMSKSDTAEKLVKLILDLAKEMKIPVIAEGVEDKIEVMVLKDMGCDIVQGYYFSRPLPVGDFENLLMKELEKRFNGSAL